MKTLNFSIIKLTICLIIGISASHYISFTRKEIGIATIGCFVISIVMNVIANRQFKRTIGFGISVLTTTICIGMLIYNLHDQKQFSNHYSKQITVSNEAKLFHLKIRERLKPSTYNEKYIADLISINQKSCKGKILLHIKRDTLQSLLSVDDLLLVQSNLSSISQPLNPNQLDYKAYLKRQYIYHQLYSENKFMKRVPSKSHSLLGFADRIRKTINKRLIAFGFHPDELGIINALLLGQRQDMDSEIYDSYAEAGAIHILAVSGLHVGIILFILNQILKPLERLRKGKTIKIYSILILLWGFAVIAGLSASVTRAVTMFSLVAIAMHLKRPTNIYNTLFISIFILLLVKPMFLFDVGFQMSYTAVFSIVSIQPLIQGIWFPKFKVVNYFWQILTVTIAAQLGVAPISLYYFHQFPALFFISNLAIIPFLGLILGFGILVIVLLLLNSLPEIMGAVFGNLIRYMNTVVSWVSQQEQFIIREISFNLIHLCCFYFLLISTYHMFNSFKARTIKAFLISVILVQTTYIYTKHNNNFEAFVIFHKSRHTILGHKKEDHLNILLNSDEKTQNASQAYQSFKRQHFIDSVSFDSLKNVYKTPKGYLMVIDSLGVYNLASFEPKYLLLRQSPKINLKRVIDSLEPKLIVADGSNYKSYVERWRQTCLKEKLPFHYTGEKGALILKD